MTTLTNLLATHRAALGKAGEQFPADSDLQRHFADALRMLAEKRPRIVGGSWLAGAGIATGTAPADFYGLHRLTWGLGMEGQPWEPGWPGPRPALRSLMDPSAAGYLVYVEPAPTAAQIAAWGATITYEYRALHVLADDATHTLPAADDSLLLLAAQIVAVRELSMRATVAPVQLHRGLGATPSASTPAELMRLLMAEWRATP